MFKSKYNIIIQINEKTTFSLNELYKLTWMRSEQNQTQFKPINITLNLSELYKLTWMRSKHNHTQFKLINITLKLSRIDELYQTLLS